jgi:hypothetical protein
MVYFVVEVLMQQECINVYQPYDVPDNHLKDINPNPGSENYTVYPCGTCDQPVTWE